MNVRNPLIIYLSWFESQDVEWADSIASEFFSSFDSLKRTYSFLKTSKEEYNKLLEEDYQARESPYYIPSKEDMEAEEEWVDGKKSGELQDYLEKFIQLEDRRFVQSIAHSLFSATEVALLPFKPLIDGANFFRNKHIKNLLLGDKKKAAEFEEELNETLRSRVAKKKTKDSWDEFKKEDFNLSTIHDYSVDIFGFN